MELQIKIFAKLAKFISCLAKDIVLTCTIVLIELYRERKYYL